MENLHVETIGVRELRQNASVYLRRVAAGESFTVTDRGRPVALLSPPPPETLYEQMLATGEILPADRPNSDIWTTPPLEPKPGFSASEELQRQREDRF